MSSLWGDNVLALPHAKEEFLNRTRGAPLVLRMQLYDRVPSRACQSRQEFIIKHLARAREVVINEVSVSYFQELKNALFSTPMPALEILSYKARSMKKPPSFELPPMSAPRLRRVTLHESFIPWNAETITELDLHRSPKRHIYNQSTRELDAELPSFPKLIELLRASCNLQRLRLCHWIPETSAKPSSIAELPHLSYISLTSRPQRCADLMDHMLPSPLAQVDLDLEMWNDSAIVKDKSTYAVKKAHTEESFRFLRVLASRVRFADAQNPRRPIAISMEGGINEADLHLQIFSPAHPTHVNASPRANPFHVGYELVHNIKFRTFYLDRKRYAAFWQLLADDLCLEDVEQLAPQENDYGGDATAWRQIFSHYPKARAVYFRDQFLSGFNAVLCTSSSENSPSRPSFLHSKRSALRIFHYDDKINARSKPRTKPKRPKGWLPDTWANLASTLETRAAMGLALKTLEVGNFKSGDGEMFDPDSEDTPPGFDAVWNHFLDRIEVVLKDGVFQHDRVTSDAGSDSDSDLD